MGNKYIDIPTHPGYKTAIKATCDYCGDEFWESKGSFLKKKRHFCSMKCYSNFRIEKLSFNEQHAYKGIRKKGESKQIYHRNYCKNHPENISHLKARRYAKEKNAEGSHSLKEWQAMKRIYRNKCAICGREIKLTKDHIIPISEGGPDYISNIQPLCRNCNSKKWKHIYENPELLNQSK